MAPSRKPPFLPWLAYNLVGVPAWYAGLQFARMIDEKAERSLDGRRQLFHRLEHRRERLRGCLWLHAASAGEVEQCRPLLRALAESPLRSRPRLLTVFSPSGHEHASQVAEADLVEYLPLDTIWSCDRMMRWLQPSALVYTRYDAWPNLVWTARSARVPLVLTSATLSPASRRHHRWLHGFFRSVYSAFDRIGCLDEEDARAFRENYDLDTTTVRVTGDTRFDQVVDRAQRAMDDPAVGLLRAQRWQYLLLGSLWPADERHCIEALSTELAENPDRGLILVPHEPTPEHLMALENRLRQASIPSTRWSQIVELPTGRRRSTAAAKDERSWRVIVVDSVGRLAELYHAAQLAYVGGGFSSGVHSVLEPAAAGIPILCGPRTSRSREAERLIARGAATKVHSSRQWIDQLRALRDPQRREEMGVRALEYLREGSGAAARNLQLVEELLFDPQGGAQAPGAST